MRNLSYSFTPARDWFVFDLDTGVTLVRGLRNARKARMEWIRRRGV